MCLNTNSQNLSFVSVSAPSISPLYNQYPAISPYNPPKYKLTKDQYPKHPDQIPRRPKDLIHLQNRESATVDLLPVRGLRLNHQFQDPSPS